MASAVLALAGAHAVSAQTFENTLLPKPQRVEAQSGPVLRLDTALPIVSVSALREPAQRMAQQLSQATGIAFRGPISSDPDAAQRPAIVLQVADLSEVVPQPGMDESYRLDSNAGGVLLEAKTRFGLQRAIATLLQMVQSDRNGYFLPALHVEDSPRFAWRGLLLDPGRHFLPVDVVERTLDAMAAVKLNVLHWHLTEDQGFRIESRLYPRLSGLGADGEFYTEAQVRSVVAYAADRGIRVMPEFDIPGHSTSWFVGYPQLGSSGAPSGPDRTFGVHDEAMDPTRESTYLFLDKFFGEMATLFPDRNVDVGGDESNGKQWLANAAIKRYMRVHGMADTHALQAYFIHRIHLILARHGKKMVGWDEILGPEISPDVVIENWHGRALFQVAANHGIAGIYAKPYYLNYGTSAGEMYAVEPLAETGVNSATEHLLLGAEACMWGEQVTPVNVESRIWPGAAAVAERLWSPASVTDVNDLYRRLAVETLRLDGAGSELLAGPQRLLRQLAGSIHPGALETLASVVEPYHFHERARAQHITEDTPLNGFADAAVYDPPLRHELPLLIDSYLHAEGEEHHRARAALGELFASWQTDGMELAQSKEPRLQIVAVRARQLAALGQLGTAMLQASDRGTVLNVGQVKQADDLIKFATGGDLSLVNFVILPSMAELFDHRR